MAKYTSKYPINFVPSGTLSGLALAVCLLLSLGSKSQADGDYRLNPGDKLEITVWQEENLHAEVTVQPDGTVSFPLAGPIPAAGKTTAEFLEALKQRLAQFIPGPEVNVRLLAAEGNMVYVTGEVAHPGGFTLKRPTDVMQAISLAGGLTEFARKNSIVILRREAGGTTQSLPFAYGDIEDGEGLEANIQLHSGDTIVVP
ncbi:polysaccharide export outer membrane protein [Methylomagnum ishizawai]|uniref:Polysaccharide export outer membrane protein n=1 Tax=Methylomagnum ishizawai TaxID=1760988 RepID=A0A1Y6D3Y5_9GAMM|nr:polysaccharide export outer membrane protein [Methylomagnum ishizawai]